MTTPKPTLPQHLNSLETLIQSYAEIALGGGDEALKDGWRGHLLQRFAELDQDFPGLRSMIIKRIRKMNKEKYNG
jgi:hypothetical protein